MVKLDVFLSRLLPQVPACPEPLALEHLKDACIEFCEKSLAIRQDLDFFYSVANLGQYDLDPPSNQHMIATVLSVRYDGKELSGIFVEDAQELPEAAGNPAGFFTSRTNNEFVLHLHPTPEAREQVLVNVALRPIRSATEVDDDLYNLYADAIIDGAIARLAKIPNQPFTDLAYAAAMQNSFREKAARAKVDSYHGRIRGNSRVKMRPFV